MAPILRKFCCWNVQQATRAAPIYALVAGTIALLLVSLDQAASDIDGFDISGGFKGSWRVLIWKEWLGLNVVMICSHIVIILASIFLLYHIRPSKVIYKQLSYLWVWLILMCVYTLLEIAIGIYMFSWYGKNSFRRPFLCFLIIFWFIRMVSNILTQLVVYSRIEEICEILKKPPPFSDSQALYNINGFPSTTSMDKTDTFV